MTKNSLFLDTSENLVLGLLDDNFEWLDYLDTREKKGSGVLHGLIFEFLKKNNLEINQIENVFLVAGPGSYTGMRLGEGFAQVLNLLTIKVFSIYHFDIPQILNTSEGFWASKAFKGEVFVYSWKGKENTYSLLKEDIFKEKYGQDSFLKETAFTHVEDDFFKNYELTSEFIQKNSKTIFSHVYKNNIRKDPYYYRPLTIEFKQTAI